MHRPVLQQADQIVESCECNAMLAMYGTAPSELATRLGIRTMCAGYRLAHLRPYSRPRDEQQSAHAKNCSTRTRNRGTTREGSVAFP